MGSGGGEGGSSFINSNFSQGMAYEQRADGATGGGNLRNGRVILAPIVAYNTSEDMYYTTLDMAINSLPEVGGMEEPETLLLFSGIDYGLVDLRMKAAVLRLGRPE